MEKVTFKNLSQTGDTYENALNNLYLFVAEQLEIEPSEAQAQVDEYVTGKIDVVDLLNDIQNELDWIPGERDNLQNAIDNVIPGLAVPANVRAVLTGLAQNQRRILQEQLRELRAWRWWIKNGKWE